MPARRITAAWVLPIDAPPIEGGAALIDADGRIAAVGPDAGVPAPPDVPADDFPGAVLLPGLINTHTHLELTGLEESTHEPDFAAWIRRLRQRKAARSREEFLAAAHRGIVDCWAAGVTTVADTGDSGTVIQALAQAGGSGIAYQEVFGLHPDDCETSLADLRHRVATLSRFAGERVRIGVSPHAPYTVSAPLYEAVARWACVEGLPVAVHVAESRAESAFLAEGRGAFADAWRGRGIPLPSPLGFTPVAWLERCGVLGPDTLCIHTVQVENDDVARLARAGAAVAHCPLSNHAHHHGAAPLGALLAAGLRVGVGTDSVASVGRLDLLAEVRAARALASLDGERAIELCTMGAARALGLEAEIGSLHQGKWGDGVVIRVPSLAGASAASAVIDAVLASSISDVVATYLAGRVVFRP
jgi:5-methylthioadenosine/S-adenosylhomocysteine deaminase